MGATYRIGPSDFFTGDDLAQDAKTLDAQIADLDNAINGNMAIPQSTWDAFQVFRSNWKAFRSDHFDGGLSSLLSAFNDSNRDELISFEKQLVEWNTTLGKYGPSLPTPPIQPSAGSGDNIADHLKNALGFDVTTIVVVVVLIVGAYLAVTRL